MTIHGMYDKTPYKQAIIALADACALLFTLIFFAALWYGYGSDSYVSIFQKWEMPVAILATWYLCALLAGLFDPAQFQDSQEFDQRLFGSGLIFTAGLALQGLLFRPFSDLTIFAVLAFGAFATFMLYCARYIAQAVTANMLVEKILVIGDGVTEKEIAGYLENQKGTGYRLTGRILKFTGRDFNNINSVIIRKNVTAVVVPNILPQKGSVAGKLYAQLLIGTPLIDSHSMYEKLFEKLASEEIEEGHFVTLLGQRAGQPSIIRNGLERLAAFILFILLLPVMIILGLGVMLTSRGWAIFRQTRTGEFGRPFTLYKFRSMRRDAEKNGPQWAKKNDARVTPFGAILRRTHLDELPQLWNVVKGELAFVGPRAERPELIALIRKEVPHFELRNVVRPGISGWAQVKFGYGGTVEEAREKLRYDLYYIKHRSLIFDLEIALRTIRVCLF